MEKYTYDELFQLGRELGVEPCDFDEWIDEMIDNDKVEFPSLNDDEDAFTNETRKENKMKKFVYVGVEKDYNERDLEMAAYGFPGCMGSKVYADPCTGKLYRENFWGDLTPIEFPWKTVVVYNGSSEHIPAFLWEDGSDAKELEGDACWEE